MGSPCNKMLLPQDTLNVVFQMALILALLLFGVAFYLQTRARPLSKVVAGSDFAKEKECRAVIDGIRSGMAKVPASDSPMLAKIADAFLEQTLKTRSSSLSAMCTVCAADPARCTPGSETATWVAMNCSGGSYVGDNSTPAQNARANSAAFFCVCVPVDLVMVAIMGLVSVRMWIV